MDLIKQEVRTVALTRQRFVRLERPGGLQVSARRGTLWITVDGEPDDIELEPGESYSFASGAPALVGAIGGDAVATLYRRRSAAAGAGFGAWWHQLTRLAGAA
jgi:hypothetical protein